MAALQRFTIHTASTVQPQRLVQNEREFLVAPCVMIIEGVLNQGLVPGEEIRACYWDQIPIVVNHPLDAEGLPLSANNPDILGTCGVGRVFRTRYSMLGNAGHELTRAQAELWIDVGLAQTCGGEAMQAFQMLETQQPLEVSTAFYSDAITTRGSFYGVPYREIHRNLRADHLALLPNSIGACDFQRGCGAPRLNHEQGCTCQTEETVPMEAFEQQPLWQRFLAMLRLVPHAAGGETLVVHQSDQDARESLYGALAREMGTDYTPLFIDSLDMEAMTFTYRQGERLRRRRWTMEDGVLTLAPEVEDVQRETTYIPVPVTQEATIEEEEPMPPTTAVQRRIDALIANARTRWSDDDRRFLEGQEEAFLMRLEQMPLDAPAHPPTTVQEAIATLPQHLQEPIQVMAEEYEERKAKAIAIILANKNCVFSQEELQPMSAQKLEGIVQMAGEEVPLRPGQQVVKEVVKEVRSYIGQGMAHVRGLDEEQPPAPPDTFARVVERQKQIGKLVA